MNIIQIFEQFPTQKDCIAHLEAARWGGDPSVTPTAGPSILLATNTAIAATTARPRLASQSARSFTTRICHLQKWFLAIMLMLNAKKGLSALQLSRDLDVNKNTAWRISMQIRKAMTFRPNQRNLLTGIVEMDETYVGGKPRKGTGRAISATAGSTSPVAAPRRLPWSALSNAVGT